MLLCLCATLALSLTRGWRSRLVPLPRCCAAMNTAQGSLWYAVLCVDSQEGYSWAIWRSIFSFLGSLHVIFIVAAQVHIQTRRLYGSRFPTFSPHLFCSLDDGHSEWGEMESQNNISSRSPTTKDDAHFMAVFPFGNLSVHFISSFIDQIICSLMFNLCAFLYIYPR